MPELYDLINEGANFDFCDENGITPLMKISQDEDATLIKLIIKQVSDINQKDKFNHTALYYATSANNLDGVKTLFNGGAKISDDIYMLAIHNDFKEIANFFDMQDNNKRFLLNNKYP